MIFLTHQSFEILTSLQHFIGNTDCKVIYHYQTAFLHDNDNIILKYMGIMPVGNRTNKQRIKVLWIEAVIALHNFNIFEVSFLV